MHLIDSGGFYGAEAVLVELVKEQRKQGLDSHICSIGIPGETEKQIEVISRSENLPVHVFRMRAGPNIIGAFKILAFAKDARFDVLHSHGYKANILFGLMPESIRQIHFVVTLHGWTSVKAFTSMWLYEKLDAFLLKNRKIIVLVSQAMLRHPNLQMVQEKCTIIENGIQSDVPVISEGEVKQKLIALKEAGNHIIGSIGRLSYEKGYDALIEAFARCGQSLVLVIMGEGPEKDELCRIARAHGIADRILFFGYVEQAGQFIPMFDVYVNSSRTEGTPITLLEAMRARVRIVARDVGGNRQLLGDGSCGLIVEDEGPDSLAKAMMKSLQEGGESVNRAYELFADRYTVAVMSDKYADVYRRLLGFDAGHEDSDNLSR